MRNVADHENHVRWVYLTTVLCMGKCENFISFYFRSKDFRQAFRQIHTLKAFFSKVPFVALSATLTTDLKKRLPGILGLDDPVLVAENPDRPNIYLDRQSKLPSSRVVDAYEAIYQPECDKLVSNPDAYPVTLMYLPLEWCSEASNYCEQLFGGQDRVNLDNCRYGIIFSNQDKTVLSVLTNDLKNEKPRVRLVFCTSSVGMGFDAHSIDRVIHGKPPRSLSDYFQQIGRCGELGKSPSLHYTTMPVISHKIFPE